MLRILLPRFYVLIGLLTTWALFLTWSAHSRDDIPATVGWLLASILCVAMLVAPLVIHTLMKRVRPPSRRGRHAQR